MVRIMEGGVPALGRGDDWKMVAWEDREKKIVLGIP